MGVNKNVTVLFICIARFRRNRSQELGRKLLHICEFCENRLSEDCISLSGVNDFHMLATIWVQFGIRGVHITPLSICVCKNGCK